LEAVWKAETAAGTCRGKEVRERALRRAPVAAMRAKDMMAKYKERGEWRSRRELAVKKQDSRAGRVERREGG